MGASVNYGVQSLIARAAPRRRLSPDVNPTRRRLPEQPEMRSSGRNFAGLADRLQVSELRRHMFHEKLHGSCALRAGCPILARHDQQRTEPTRCLIELPELARDRIRITQEIHAGLGELVEGDIIT